MRIATRAALCLLLWACACSSTAERLRERGLAQARAGQLEVAVATLRRAVAADPRDAAGHAALGRLERQLGRPGAALRELDEAERLGDDGVRAELAALYAERGQARAALGHRERWRDLERAAALDRGFGRKLGEARRLALTDAGLWAWASGDEAGALSLWRRAPGAELAVIDVVADAERAPLPLLGAVALRAHAVAGAGAWPLLDAYARRGGDDQAVLAAHAQLWRWRDASAPAAPLPSLEQAGLAEAALAELEARIGPLSADEVAWAAAAAAATWLRGRRDAPVDAALADLVAEQLARDQVAQAPAWARPALYRLLGAREEAQRAYDAAAGEPAPPGAEALEVLEYRSSRLDGESDAPLALLARATRDRRLGRGADAARELSALDFDETTLALRLDLLELLWREGAELSWQRAPAHARWLRTLPLFAGAGAGRRVAAAYLAEGTPGDASAPRLRDEPEIGGTPPPLGEPAPGTPIAPPGCPGDERATPAYRALVAAARADARLGEAQARDFIDAAVVPSCRGLAVVELYLRAGDPARAMRFADELLAVEPGDGGVLALAVRAAAAAGDGERARLYLQAAEFHAHRRGAAGVAAARVLIDAGLPVEAIGAARQALALAEGPMRAQALMAVAVASAAAGREADARRAAAQLVDEAGAFADAARRRLRRALADAGIGGADAWPELVIAAPTPRERALAGDEAALSRWLAANTHDIDAALLLAARRGAGGAKRGQTSAARVLQVALSFSPWSIPAREARAIAAPSGSLERQTQMALLLLIGIGGEGPRARAALATFARLCELEGQVGLAAAARREAAWR